jgi:adenylate kinase
MAVAAETALGSQVRLILERGALVPDQLTIAIVRERLVQADCRNGFVLDGFPRTLAQGEALDSILADSGVALYRAVYLEISEERAVARLAGRRTCTHCGATYHVQADPPERGNLCRRCGHPVVQRADDAEDVQRSRIAAYRRDTVPLLGYYQQRGILLSVDGDRPSGEVAADLIRLLADAAGGGGADDRG